MLHLVQHPAAALQVQADLVDARLHRHVQLAQRRRADRAVGGQQVAVLEVTHARFERRVEHSGSPVPAAVAAGTAVDCGTPAVAARARSPVSARRSRSTGTRGSLMPGFSVAPPGNLRPAAERRDAAIRGQRGAARGIHPVVGANLVDTGAHAILGDGVVHELHRIGLADLAQLEIPARIERDRVDLAEVQVVEDQRIRVARQQVERGALERAQRAAAGDEPPQRREAVVGGAQPVVLDVLQQVGQRTQAARIPQRQEAVHLVQPRQRARRAQRVAGRLDFAATGAHRVDAVADRLDDRVRRGGRRGLRGARGRG